MPQRKRSWTVDGASVLALYWRPTERTMKGEDEMKKHRWWIGALIVLVTGSLALAACATPTPQVVEVEVTRVVEEEVTRVVEAEVTRAVEKEVTRVVEASPEVVEVTREVEKVVTATPGPEREPAAEGGEGDAADEEANKAIVRRYYEDGWNARDLDAVEDILASDLVMHMPPFGHSLSTLGDLKTRHMYFQSTGFPDLALTIDDMVAEEDQVVVRYTFKGTHEGEYDDFRGKRHSPTGLRVKFSGIAIYRCADGKIVEVWDHVDWLGLYQQLGVIR